MLVREASRRTTGMSHFAVQIMGGIALFEGGIAEMQTGEGKTLTAVLPAFLRALPGKGCHIVTVNDYLAKRDAEEMGPIYKALGLTVGCIQTDDPPFQRKIAYAQDITYGTAKEMGFDFLRDRLKKGASAGNRSPKDLFGDGDNEQEALVQRDLNFALVDEADSILIDEARTPLIIGVTMQHDKAALSLYDWSEKATVHLNSNKDFVYDPKKRFAYLTDAGCRTLLMTEKPSELDSVDTERIHKHVEQALTARHAFQLNRDYVIAEDKIVIVDESTGRMMDGRTWQDGLHQAMEAKEEIPITDITGQAARITVQNYFRQYRHLAGMTGTAVQARREFRKTYQMPVTPIPTNKPCIREGFPTKIFGSLEGKQAAIIEEVKRLQEKQCAILIGTPSVTASESLAREMKKQGIESQVLNAKYHEQEADIISNAGEATRVTIATNMAGRGTDILLGDTVRSSGGLHVLATEMHSSTRIDRQLIGRSARQGDPGCYQFFLSLEDELLRCLEPEKLQRIQKRASADKNGQLASSWISFFKKTQRFLEKSHITQRKHLLRAEKHRGDLHKKMGLDPYLELTES